MVSEIWCLLLQCVLGLLLVGVGVSSSGGESGVGTLPGCGGGGGGFLLRTSRVTQAAYITFTSLENRPFTDSLDCR